MHFRICGRETLPPFVAVGGFLLALGCSSPTDPPSPPGGGNTYVLDFQEFEDSVSPVLEVHGCDAVGGCHGGGIRGTLILSPPGEKDPTFDFEQLALQIDGLNPSESPLLTKPLALAAGGEPHSYEAFGSTQDEDYLTILTWITNGDFQ